MISLPKLLLEAAGRKASEIVLEVGKRPRVATPEGSKEFGEPLGEAALFEALAGVLGPEQQAELAVGNVVEFRVSGHSGEWKILVEPAANGLTLRGRRGGHGSRRDLDIGTPVDLPPLAPFEPERQGEAPAPEPVLKRTTQVDLGLKSYAEDDPPWADAPQPAPPMPGDAEETLDGKSPLPPPPPMAEPSAGGVASGVDFAIVPGEDSGPVVVHGPTPLTAHEGVPVQTAGGNDHAAPTGAASPNVAAGTLCFVAEAVDVTALAAGQGAPVTVLDEPRAVDLAGRMLAELPAGVTYVVCLEDPSRITAWVLRRLEEGSRVFVQTRASSVGGATRIFLGLHGKPAAEWLAAHPVQWVAKDTAPRPVDRTDGRPHTAAPGPGATTTVRA